MTNLIGRKVNLVEYYPKIFTEKVVGPLTKKIYKITYDYPFKITKVFKNEKKVTEDLSLNPISTYNKVKIFTKILILKLRC